ncbi:aldolase [Cohnella sp. AR92]|nr:aldolase [Cohnella sp. AR92]
MPALRASVYRAFGLRISSRIPLPELPLFGVQSAVEAAQMAPDVEIDWGDYPRLMKELEDCGSNFAYSRGGGRRFLFLIPETAVYAIEDGRRIAVAPAAGADPEKVRVYLLGTCLGALLLMRRVLPLHGSAVVIDGKAYAFLGDSGAGKSTLAAACAAMGHRLASDDVVAVALDGAGAPVVYPSYPQQKLWRESLEGLGMEGEEYRPIYRETEKFAVPSARRFSAEPVPLAGVFELAKPEAAASEASPPGLTPNSGVPGSMKPDSPEPSERKIALTSLSGFEQLRVLMKHTYRNRLIPRLGLEGWHFRTSAAVAARIEACRLQRPRTGFTAPALAKSIEQYVKKGAIQA